MIPVGGSEIGAHNELIIVDLTLKIPVVADYGSLCLKENLEFLGSFTHAHLEPRGKTYNRHVELGEL